LPRPNAICIGSVHWDYIGMAAAEHSGDVPGTIERKPGGVALNVAAALNFLGVATNILGAVGGDSEGVELIESLTRIGVGTDLISRVPDSRTDQYIAIENRSGLVAAVADTRTLESAGARIVETFKDIDASIREQVKAIVLDGNLPIGTINELNSISKPSRAKIALVCASGAKAARLKNVASRPESTIYLNIREANSLLGASFCDARNAAEQLCELGFNRAVVTNGSKWAAMSTARENLACLPPQVEAVRATGSGDAFAAAHIAGELAGASAELALENAASFASSFAAGKIEF